MTATGGGDGVDPGNRFADLADGGHRGSGGGAYGHDLGADVPGGLGGLRGERLHLTGDDGDRHLLDAGGHRGQVPRGSKRALSSAAWVHCAAVGVTVDLIADGASNGTRTRDIQDHNLALYQLSYARHPGGRV